MDCFEVFLEFDGDTIVEATVADTPITIGRAPDADVTLPNDGLSRYHAQLVVEDGKLKIDDLGSRNGVYVNDLQIKSSYLYDTDVVVLGVYTLRVKAPATAGARMNRRSSISYEAARGLSDRIVAHEQGRPLSLLYRVSRALMEPIEINEQLRNVLDLLAAEMPVARGYVITRDRERRREDLAASIGTADNAGQPFSNTLLFYVMRSRNAILTDNAQNDPRFNRSDSIIRHGIRSAVVAPMPGRRHIYGVLYLDAKEDDREFNEADLQVATIVAQMLGAAIEHALLIESRVQQERLAAVGEAVAGIVHDMRNILTGVSLGAEVIGNGQQKQHWSMVESGMRGMRGSIARFQSLVQNMLSYTRGGDLNLAQVSPSDIVFEVAQATHAQATQNDIRLHVDAPDEVEPIAADAPQLYRALLNLTTNAIEACDPGGAVTLSLHQTPKQTQFQVEDTGRGIAKKDLPRVREAFFSTKGTSGTGLGLAVTYKIVEQHGGHIEIESEPGRGTCFRIALDTPSSAATQPTPRQPAIATPA